VDNLEMYARWIQVRVGRGDGSALPKALATFPASVPRSTCRCFVPRHPPCHPPTQVGAFSGVMRSHDRGMSGGGCANSYNAVTAPGWGSPVGDCSIVQPWAVGPTVFTAIRAALQARERLLPCEFIARGGGPAEAGRRGW
jgi:hypothetical protein